MTRILITGASGMLGTALLEEFSNDNVCVALARHRPVSSAIDWLTVDIENAASLKSALLHVRPEVVIHAAAITDVDACEKAPAQAERVNCDAVGLIAAYCSEHRAKLIYVSTDSVFDGTKVAPYCEEDPVNPLNVYARTKRHGEILALNAPAALVLRTNIFGWRPQRKNSFGEWILDALRNGKPLTMFDDVFFSPIASTLFAMQVRQCLSHEIAGLFHAGSRNCLSKHQFALLVADAFKLPKDGIMATSVDDKGLAAPRPKNMALNSARLSALLASELPSVADSIAAWKNSEPFAGADHS